MRSTSQVSKKIVFHLAVCKGLGMKNLQYERRIYQKHHSKVTITMTTVSQFFESDLNSLEAKNVYVT